MKLPRLPWGSARTPGAAVTLVLPGSLVETMRIESELGLPNETGGVLVGYADATNRTVITGIVGPGPRAFRTPTRFRRDGNYAQREVDRLHRESDGRDDYVGEWHSHPAPVGPSSFDRESMGWIGENERYRRERPLLIIMQRTRWRSWRPLVFRWVDGRLAAVDSTAPSTQRN
jgi:integrative and conjugative element protein (TIGR02256 family)